MDLFFISKMNNHQISLLAKIADKNNISYRCIFIDDPKIRISISSEEIEINGYKIEDNSVFFLSGIYYQFPFVPEAPQFNDWSFFQDFHLSQQQLKSQLYSLLYLLSVRSDRFIVINDFSLSISLSSRYEILERIKKTGLKVPEICLTNSYLKAKEIFDKYNGLLWSYPDSNSPIRNISRERLNDLFGEINTLSVPYLLYEPVAGSIIRLTFFENDPILVSLISPPERECLSEELERFSHFIPEGNELQRLGSELYKQFGNSFYEVFGVLDLENKFWIYDISFDPNISLMDKTAQNYILSRLLEYLLKKTGRNVEIPLPPFKEGKRRTIYLKRMLIHLFEIQQSQE